MAAALAVDTRWDDRRRRGNELIRRNLMGWWT
jgi:hypothetical protein